MRSPIRPLLCAVLLCVSIMGLFCVPGCVTKEDLQQARDDIQARSTELATSRDTANDKLADPTLAPADKQALQEFVTLANAQLKTNGDALAKLDDAIAKYQNPLDTALSYVMPFVPEPFRSPITIGVGAVTLLLRNKQLSDGLGSLAQSTVKLAQKSPQVADAIKTHEVMLRQTQTRTAKRAIDKAQGKQPQVVTS